MDDVTVVRGAIAGPERVGPYMGTRDGNCLAYTLTLPEDFIPWPGQQRIETVLVDLELGVSMSQPCWQWRTRPDGRRTPGVDARLSAPNSWYVDLVQTRIAGNGVELLDQYIDIIVPTDGRQVRMLDLDEFGDALEAGALTVSQAVDGLRRWQAFLDRYLYSDRDPSHGFADFPPRRLVALAEAHNARCR